MAASRQTDMATPQNMHNNCQPTKKPKSNYCILCRKVLPKYNKHDHMHGLPHHIELDKLLGKVPCHDCQACELSSMVLQQYAQHIAMPQHRINLKRIKMQNVKPISLYNTLNHETIKGLLRRNKELKKERKKESQKKKKKRRLANQKEPGHTQAGQKQAGHTQAGHTQAGQKQAGQKQADQKQAGQKQAGQKQADQKQADQKQADQKQAGQKQAGQNQAGQTHTGQKQAASGLKNVQQGPNTFKQQALGPQQKGTYTGAVQKNMNQLRRNPPRAASHYAYQRAELDDFTSDQLPDRGSVIFTDELPPEPTQNVSASNSQPKPVIIQGMSVTTMLRELRRAMGVREPCRADREARKQNAEAEAQLSELCSSLETLKKEEAKQSNNAAQAGKSAPRNNVAAEQNTPGPSASIQHPQQLGSKTKVRIAHKAAADQKSAEDILRKVTPKLTPKAPAVSRPKFKQSWKQMKKEKMPRFGIESVNSQPSKATFDLGVDEDLILSEGFHWESLSNAHMPLPPSLPAHPPSCLTSTPLPTRDATPSASRGETRSTTGAPDEGGSFTLDNSRGPTAAATSVKVQAEHGNPDTNKRKHQHLQDNDVPDVEAVVKRRKFMLNNDQDPMDKLLAMSLREEELSQSLQDVDKSLVLARNALQAAYTEVRRLMLLRQQCTAEVDGLRAKRIEILQSMQEVYSGSSNVEQVATTSAAAPADVVHPDPTSASSSRLLVPHSPTDTHQSSVINQPQPALPAPKPNITTIKREAMIPPPSRQPSDQTVSPPPTSLPAVAPPTPKTQTRADDPNPLNPANLLCTQKKQVKPVGVTEQTESISREEVVDMKNEKMEEPLAIEPVQGNDARTLDKSASAVLINDNSDKNADTVEVMEPKMVVIDIDESENEDSPDMSSTAPGPQELPSKSDNMECSTASTQTIQQTPFKMKAASPVASEREDTPPPETVEMAGENGTESALGYFLNHTEAVHGLQVHEGVLYTCSADMTARAYSLLNLECLGVFEGHKNRINCLLVASSPNTPARLYTGSSDSTIRIYSIKTKKCLETISLADRVLCMHMAWTTVFVGLANGSVATFDLKTSKPLDVFECHGPRAVSCLGTSQEGARRVLLVGSYDSTISVRDAKSGLLLRSLEGHTKTVLCMKVVNDLVFSGSSDTSVHAHNIHTGQLIRIYKGHGHAVTSIVILGKVMVTSCLDKLIRVYELQTHDRLQVYGGHSDMVMCMAVHKSVIYTGCYDGSVQAVKLNLMKNYRCWWQNCCLIFGMAEHLLQHLTRDHTNPKLEVVNCRWRGCNKFFPTQQAVKEEVPGHMQNHVDVDSKVES
ncbi:zinc finger protein 106-like isoform X3 [Syngnathus typhle]|uniref:zinc finger protein 106-like isoform X3 n=1 Tax=Syngnathus typhle TaxID=161592 RepID=UPI002A6AA70B|nr:zinc finger protein 106-like isoform X3 [Syngnathus typhle]